MQNERSVNIETVGLRHYLDSTKAKHNDQGYDRFVFYLRSDIKLGYMALGRLMNVSRNTARKWVEVYRREQASERKRK